MWNSKHNLSDEAVANCFIATYVSARSSCQEAVARDGGSFGAHVHESVDTVKDPALLPPETEIKKMFKTLNPSKAVAENLCGPDLFKAAAGPLARLMHPLYIKVTTWVRMAAGWKCGRSAS